MKKPPETKDLKTRLAECKKLRDDLDEEIKGLELAIRKTWETTDKSGQPVKTRTEEIGRKVKRAGKPETEKEPIKIGQYGIILIPKNNGYEIHIDEESSSQEFDGIVNRLFEEPEYGYPKGAAYQIAYNYKITKHPFVDGSFTGQLTDDFFSRITKGTMEPTDGIRENHYSPPEKSVEDLYKTTDQSKHIKVNGIHDYVFILVENTPPYCESHDYYYVVPDKKVLLGSSGRMFTKFYEGLTPQMMDSNAANLNFTKAAVFIAGHGQEIDTRNLTPLTIRMGLVKSS